MQFVKTLSVLALATGAVVAMPANVEKRQWMGGNRWWSRPNGGGDVTVTGYDSEPTDWSDDGAATSTTTWTTTTTTVAVSVTATPTYGGNFFGQGPPADSTPTETPEVTTTWTQPASAPESTWAPQAPAPSSAEASPSPSPVSSGGSGGQDDYMSVVSKWRAAGGLPALTQDSTLEGNALKTSTNSVGGLIHELNPGTMAQVLAPGNDGNFESVYVGGWLCEIPTLPGLNGICATEAQGWDHSDGETGHAQILTSTSYTKIGCALAESTGVWACDLA